MENIIYKICDRLKGHSFENEYFEVIQAEQKQNSEQKQNNDYIIVVRVIEKESEK